MSTTMTPTLHLALERIKANLEAASRGAEDAWFVGGEPPEKLIKQTIDALSEAAQRIHEVQKQFDPQYTQKYGMELLLASYDDQEQGT